MLTFPSDIQHFAVTVVPWSPPKCETESCSHATISIAHPRFLPTDITRIALSEGSQSPLHADVSLELVLFQRKQRGCSSYSAY